MSRLRYSSTSSYSKMIQDSYTYHDRQIGSRIWSIKFCHFNDLGWPLPRFQGHAIIRRWISHKRYKITTSLQWNTNRNLRPTQWCKFEWPWVTLSDSKTFNEMEHRTAFLRQLSFLLTRTIIIKYTQVTLSHSGLQLGLADLPTSLTLS